MNSKSIFSLVLRLTVAIVLLQTLYFKFTAHPDSVYIFSELGVEPWGRIGLGIVELIVAVLILYPKTQLIGVILSLGIIVGAIASHLWVIGLDVKNDGGGLFSLAMLVFLADSIYLFMNRIKILKQWDSLIHA